MKQLQVLIAVFNIEFFIEEEPEGDHRKKVKYEVAPI